MNTVGIICEYNPLHLGHQKQMHMIRDRFGMDTGIVCLMSGNFVQRGAPAIFDKSIRAKAAVMSGADLVLELPVETALSSAEGFAAGGVRILSGFCDALSFGAETGTAESLMKTAQMLLSPEFPPLLREQLDRGLSFPAARQTALEQMDCDRNLLSNPNDILAVEYCKAILAQGSGMEIMPVLRQGSYNDELPDQDNPSATSLRRAIGANEEWLRYIPEQVRACFQDTAVHTLQAGERAILAKLRTMTEQEFEAVPYGSEGLWRKFMHMAREKGTLEEILTAVKSKRYTRTRLDRMLLCAFLGLTKEDMEKQAPYVRVLALNDRGRDILKSARKTGEFLNAGEAVDHPYWIMEQRLGDLYGLFREDIPDLPGSEQHRRVCYHPQENGYDT